MVNFHSMNNMIHTVNRMSKLMQAKKTRDDTDTIQICSSAVDDLRRMQDELRPMIEALDNYEQRMVLTLRYLKGYDYPWIADNMNVIDRTVYRYLRMAKDKLAELFPGQIEL